MSYDDCVRIERAENGYTVSMKDPKIDAANRRRSAKGNYDTPYLDPRKDYVFTDIAAVLAFLKANLDKALPKQDFDSAFELMTEDDD